MFVNFKVPFESQLSIFIPRPEGTRMIQVMLLKSLVQVGAHFFPNDRSVIKRKKVGLYRILQDKKKLLNVYNNEKCEGIIGCWMTKKISY